MKKNLKASIIWPIIRDTYIGLRDLPQLPAAYLHPWRRTAIKRLAALKGCDRSKTETFAPRLPPHRGPPSAGHPVPFVNRENFTFIIPQNI